MSSNNEKNKNKIINDYYKLVGAFLNCTKLYESKDLYVIKETDTEEEKRIKTGSKEDLLSELGKVGEKLLKYILGLEYLKTYPNCDENSFEAFFKRSTSLINFASSHNISQDDEKLTSLIGYVDDNNQKAHNYDYWFSVVEVIMPDYLKKIQRFLVYLEQSDLFVEYCKNHGGFFDARYIFDGVEILDEIEFRDVSKTFEFAVFPNWSTVVKHKYELKKEQIDILLATHREAIRISGDIFTRFRYAANNPDNRDISIDDTYNIISKLVAFVMMIHENNDNLDFDLDLAYAKYKALELGHYIGVSKEEVEKKMKLDLGYLNYLNVLLNKNYPAREIEKILSLGIPKEDLWKVVEYEIFARDIEYSRTIGINDIYEISKRKQKYIEEGSSPKI